MNNKGKRTLSAILAGLILTSMSSTVLAEETTTNKEHVEQINQIKPNEVTSQQPDIQQNLTAPQVELFDFSLDNLIDGIHTWGIDHGQVDNDTGKLGSQLTGYSVDFMKQIEDVAKNGTVIDGSLLENITVNQSDGTTKEIEAVKINLGKITIPIENGNAQETLNTHWATILPDILAAGGAFLHDHPEVFYLNGQVYSGAATAMQGQNVLILEPYIAFTYQDIYQDRESRIERNNQMNQKIDEITSAVSGQTPIEQLNYFNAWLTMNNRYNPLLPNEPSTAHEATSALLSNSALEANKNDGPVCEGYAKAMKLLCEKVGIPCAIPVGLAKSSANDQGENHMWNYVKLDGKWYAIDVTWNDPIYSGTTVTDKLGLKSYFLIGSQTPNHNGLAFSDGHQENGVILPGYVFDYPTISTTAHQDAEKVYLISETPVTLTNQADLKIGDKISDGQLTGGTYFMLDQGNKKTVAGKLAWKNPNNTLTDGENTLTWEFTPDNSSLNCFPVTGSFIVKLDKESGTQEAGYQEPKNLSIAYQTGLTLKEVALPDGWTWDNPDTILTVGTKNYPATYTPEDTEMYTPVKKELSVAVTQTSLSLDVQTDLDKQWHGQDIKLIVTVAEDKTKALPAADDINIKATNAKVKTALEATNTPNVFEATYTVEGENDDIASFVVTVQNDEFGTQTQTVEVTILEEYTNELSGTPTSVKLGEDIDITGIQLKTQYGSGRAETTVDVTADMLSGYDKHAVGENSIGPKTISVEVDQNRKATFDITVEDVLKDMTVNAPTKLLYDLTKQETALDLTGATITPVMQSQLAQTPIDMTTDMLELKQDIFIKAGKYPVAVSYQGITKKDAFTITIMDTGANETGYQVPTITKTAYQEGLTLNDISLPEQWEWENSSTALSIGTNSYQATYTPKDTELYHPVTVEIPVEIVQGTLNLTVQTDKDSLYPDSQIKLTITIADNKLKTLPTADQINITATNVEQIGNITAVAGKSDTFEAVFDVTGAENEKVTFEITVGNEDYTAATKKLEFTIKADTCTHTIIGAPSSVKLGEDIDVTNMQLKTEHESGKEPITTKVTLDMLSGYDKEATGQNSIGTKTITVKIDENRFATFDITVEDVVKGLEVTAPNTVNYDWCINGNTLDLTGATVSLLMQSQIKQPAVELTQDMIDITDRTLSLVGNYPVTVSYQEFTKTNAFTIIVNDKPINTPITEAPSKDKPSASITELPETIKESDVVLIITSISEKLKDIVGKIQEELANLEQQTLSFSASLIDTANGNAQINASGKVTITIPYPADTSKDKFTFTLYKLKAATTREVDPEKVEIPCITTENGIQFTENSAGDLGNYIIAYQEKDSSDSNHPSDNENVGIIIGSTTAGWKQNETGWRYEYSDGTYSVNQWEQIDKIWYHFDDNGYMQTGWINIPSGWYYLNPDGSMTTGWQLIDGKWYYMNEQGTMQTGWIQVSSGWYYLNPDGSMATGWQLIDDTWYYLNEQGTMQTGWVQINDTWYLLDQSGAMLTGWHWVGDNCYYMDQTGAMLASVTTPDGYQVDASGAWTE